MIEESFQYLTRGDETFLVVGGALAVASGVLATFVTILSVFTFGLGLILYPIVLVPSVFLLGYYVRVLGATANGSDVPPSFDRFGDLGVRGVVALLVLVVYYAIPAVIVAGTVGLGAIVGMGGGVGDELGALTGLLGVLVAGVLTLGLTYVFPAALTHYAHTDSVTGAFAFGDILAIVLSADYVVAWLFGFLIFAVGSVLAFVVGLVPFVGWILASAVQFLMAIPAYRAFGLAYRNASGGGRTGPERPRPQTDL